MKRILIEAGLGKKRLVLAKNKDAENLRDALLEHYPKLKDAGGYELMPSSSRTLLKRFLFQVMGIRLTICPMRVDLAPQYAT